MKAKTPLQRKLKYLFVAIAIGIAGLLFISYMHAYHFTHFTDASIPRTDPKTLSVADKIGLVFTGIKNPHQKDTTLPDASYQTIDILGEKKLESWYIPNERQKGLIIFYHGYTGNKSQMLTRAMALHDLGYSTAIVGFRGSGNSEGNYTTIGYEESIDVINSYRFYKDKFPEQPIILFGTSMGAAAILKALHDENLPVKGIIVEYPFGSLYQSVRNRFKVMGFPEIPLAGLLTLFGGLQLNFNAFEHNPVEYAQKVNVPTLYLAGDHDDRVTNEETKAVFQNINTKEKQLHVFKGAGHENFSKSFKIEWLSVCDTFLSNL